MTEADKAVALANGNAIQRIYADGFQSDPGSFDFSDLGFRQVDHITGTDPGGADRNLGVVLAPLDADGPVSVDFHGTQTKPEWEADGWAIPKQIDPPGVMVHGGMYDIWSTCRLGSARPLLPTLHSLGLATVGGHSLGCFWATILAALVGADDLICFAPSKPGDRRLADWVQRQVRAITLFANPNDVVPKVPITGPAPFDFQHVADLTMIGPGDVSADWENSHVIASYLHLLQNTPTV